LLDSLINCKLCLFKGKDMSMLFTSHTFLEIEFNLRNADSLLKDRVRKGTG
jgi:hypothetical protein